MSETALAPRRAETDVHLIARDPVEMKAARADLEAWLRAKISAIDAEVDELERAHESAKPRPFADTVKTALYNQITRHKRLQSYYEKLLAATEAGYTLIPNFPIDVFAVRVTKKKPTGYAERLDWKPTIDNEKPANARIGEGEYKSPNQLVRNTSSKEIIDGKEHTRYFQEATEYLDVDFPLIAARAELLDATAEAMALKVFDQIGICPPAQRRGDPMIIGQICFPNGYSPKMGSFIIAWYLDLRTL
jgi:hypothetical protein